MHASVGSKYGKCMPTDSCLFCLFLCISEDTLEEVKKKGRRGKNQRFETSQRNRKVNMGYGLWLQPWRYASARRGMPSGGIMVRGCRALILIRIMGSHIKVAISVPSKHGSVAFSFLFNFLSSSILFQGSFTSQHYTAWEQGSAFSFTCLCLRTYIDTVMYEGSLCWNT